MDIIKKLQTEHLLGTEYALRNGASLLRTDGCSKTDFDRALATLISYGYQPSWERTEGEMAFAGFSGFGQSVTVSYAPVGGIVRVISEEEKEMPLQNKQTGDVPTLVTQIRMSYYGYDCGMCYLIRLSDGRFVVIDSGMGEFDEPEHFLELLEQQNVREGKPVIAAWFISHPHGDHFLMMVQVMNRYRDRFALERILYNFPMEERAGQFSPTVTQFFEMIESLEETQVLTPRTGQQLRFADTVFDVLYTSDDMCPRFVRNVNETSLVLRMEVNGRRILWLADAMGEASSEICRRYPAESLKCEILQVGHHGYHGGSPELFRRADPEVLLWPCPNFWYPVVSRYDYNDFLLRSRNIRCIFVGGQEETVLDMSKPINPSQPFADYAAKKAGEVLYQEDFRGNSPRKLFWSCVTGGATGYRALELVLRDGECDLTAGDAWSVCEMLQPGQMAEAPSFTLKLSGCMKADCEAIGLFWNYDSPTVFQEQNATWLQPAEGDFVVTLTADFRNGTAALYQNGQLISVTEYRPAARRGIYLIMRNASVTLRNVQVMKGTID